MPSGHTRAIRAGFAVALAVVMGGRAGAQMTIPGLGGGVPPLAPGLGAPAALPGAAAPVAAAPRTLWSFFGLSHESLAACRAKFCATPLGSMANNMVLPYASMTGGLVPQLCPPVPTDAQAAALAASQGPNSAEAVAAKIKQDEAEAKARRAAVRYLSTVDCHYWPEAEAALIVSLRDDRNECVRYEAALALLNGCCCTEKTIEALNIVVSGSEKDGKPSETSERVRATAFAALQSCLCKYQPKPAKPLEPAVPIPLERTDGAVPAGLAARAPRPALEPQFRRVAYYYQTLPLRPAREVVAEAQATVARLTGNPSTSRVLVTGQRTVYHALARAAGPQEPAPAAAEPALPAAQSAPSPVSAQSQSQTQASPAGPPAPAAAPFAAGPPPVVPSRTAPAPPAAGAPPAPPRDAVVRTAFTPPSQPTIPRGQRSLLGVFRRSLNPEPK